MTNAVVTGTPNVQILVAKYQKEPKLHREKVGHVQDELEYLVTPERLKAAKDICP